MELFHTVAATKFFTRIVQEDRLRKHFCIMHFTAPIEKKSKKYIYIEQGFSSLTSYS